ncbi:PKD domain-containing protein [Agrococcus terreus]|uniref:PKD domain-containing protein n=1 Tax=Agrococcus terreus TaxID=574649 RepID=A0ABQ2KHI7_9MICO|nr:PKD domain-containing protein [Agrococcus terreus]GGN81859.1 hypothetical protein GCM10010968_11050 [Agrococcus terreus]
MAAAAALGALLAGAVATPAWASPPDAATLVAPADGGTTTTASPTLSVVAGDPDGGSVDVTFEGRPRGATVPGGTGEEPFSLVVVPDTQNYSDGEQARLEAQLRWIRDTRSTLDTAFVVQVGDLVGDWFIPRQWNNVSTAFRILDDAGVPNTVLPGNHDFDNATGDLGPYNAWFPASRYAGASWNTATTRYGGHLGQSQFGPDPIDRGNGDSYALFSAGGRHFLVLNLEWEAPRYALDWADRVLAAHPDRTVIMATHSFITVDGTRLTTPQRPGGTSPAALWQDFVRTHCQIRLVVAGHERNGENGEARRTDLNACGQPVQQILSNYQSRPNGGDGWLRYYTFDPATDTMRATTYSPTLDRFETDASSAFTLPFELSEPQPAPFTAIATRTVAAGATASATWTGLQHETDYEWRAVVDDGTTRTTSATWTLRTPAPQQTALAADAFSRTLSGAWGSADTGGPWTVTGGSAAFSVGGGRGVVALAPSHTREARLQSLSTSDAVVEVQVSSDVASAGGTASASINGRLVGTQSYAARVRFEPGGVLRMYLLRNEAALGMHLGTWSPGQAFTARFSVTGTSPTQLAAKVWPTAGGEPPGWQLTATDSTAGLQQAGMVTLKSSLSASSTVAVQRLLYDDLRVVSSAAPPANQPPTASFTTDVSALRVTTDAAASTDADGTIASYAWSFGDGSTASGRTAAHDYASPGDYIVRLTVADDDGATATTTRTVTATAPPNQPPTATIGAPQVDGRSVSVSGAGSTDADGTVTSYAWDFGDGATATGATATHEYATDGTRTITLVVTDDDGATATATRQVTVTAPVPNQAPTASFTTGGSGMTATVDASGSSDPDGSIVAYAWQLGDGSTASGRTASRTYATPGTYVVTLTVTDDDGARATTTRSVTATAPPNQAPTAVIGAPSISGRTVTVSGAGSSDADGTIASYAWSFGDGGTATGSTATWTYPSDGTRTITLTVTDDDGATAVATRQVTVSAVAVVAADTFGRAVSGGWGTADAGGAWSATGGSAAYSVAGGQGIVTLAPSHTREARLGASGTSTVTTVRVSSDVASVGGTASATVVGRLVGTSTYSARLRFEPNGVIRLYLLRDEVALGGGSYVLPGAYAPGEAIMVRLSVRGTSPTSLGAMIWRASGPEPSTWQLQATDATAALQAAGTVTIKSSVSASSTVATTRLRYDDYRVTTS